MGFVLGSKLAAGGVDLGPAVLAHGGVGAKGDELTMKGLHSLR